MGNIGDIKKGIDISGIYVVCGKVEKISDFNKFIGFSVNFVGSPVNFDGFFVHLDEDLG